MPARYVLEGRTGQRCRAADDSHPISHGGFVDPLHARLGMARTGNLAGAKEEIETMKVLRTTLQRADQSYWADGREQMLAFAWSH